MTGRWSSRVQNMIDCTVRTGARSLYRKRKGFMMRLSELTEGINVKIEGNQDIQINDITNDSRQVTTGSLYFAIPGAKVDGAKFIAGAINDGVSVVVTEHGREDLKKEFGLTDEELDRITLVITDNARYAMGVMSSRFYGEPSKKLTVIGITGTKGKTTTLQQTVF